MSGWSFHAEARREYLEAVNYYHERRPGLGGGFTLEVEKSVGEIVANPLRWPIYLKDPRGDVRRFLTHTFRMRSSTSSLTARYSSLQLCTASAVLTIG